MSLTPSSPIVPAHRGTLHVHLLGLVDHGALLGLQEQNVYELSGRDDHDGILLLAEQAPCITVGREGSRNQITLDDEELARRSLNVQWVARGGGAIAHAPGQLAVCLQLPLHRLGLSLGDYRARMEEAVVAACREMKFFARRAEQATGVWSRGGQVAAWGAALKSGITCHGLFVNVSIDPRWFELTQPLPPDTRWTSLQLQRLDPVRMPQVREALIRHIGHAFGYSEVDLATGHPALRRVRQRVSVPS